MRIYPWQWAVLEMMYDPATINRLRTMCGPRQLTRHAYPGQASTRAQRPTKPCTCRYYVITSPDGYVVMPSPAYFTDARTTDTHILGPLRCPVASLFIIDPWCPHHGLGPTNGCCPHHQ